MTDTGPPRHPHVLDWCAHLGAEPDQFWQDPDAEHHSVGSYLWRINGRVFWAHMTNDDFDPDASWPLRDIVDAVTLPDLALAVVGAFEIDEPAADLEWGTLNGWITGRSLSRILNLLDDHERQAVLSLLVLRDPDFGLWWDRYTRLTADPDRLARARDLVAAWMTENNDGLEIVAPAWLVVNEPDPALWPSALRRIVDGLQAQENPDMRAYR